MVNTGPVAVMLSELIYLSAGLAGGLTGYLLGRPLRRRIIARWGRG
jgi:membrane protein YqaA with SNARE-associated domain